MPAGGETYHKKSSRESFIDKAVGKIMRWRKKKKKKATYTDVGQDVKTELPQYKRKRKDVLKELEGSGI